MSSKDDQHQHNKQDGSENVLDIRHENGPIEGELSLNSSKSNDPEPLQEIEPVRPVEPTNLPEDAEASEPLEISHTPVVPEHDEPVAADGDETISSALAEPQDIVGFGQDESTVLLSQLGPQQEGQLMSIQPVDPLESLPSEVPIQPPPYGSMIDPLSNQASVPTYVTSGTSEPLQPFSPNIANGLAPPPQANPVPFFLDPRGPYARIGAQPVKKRRRSRKGLGAVLTVFGLLVVAGLVYVAMQGSGSSSDGLFQAALAKDLSTANVTQTTTIGNDTVTLKQDISDVKNPKVSADITVSSQSVQFQGYATLSNSYVNYSQLGGLVGDNSNAAAQLTNKWVQIRNENTLPPQYAPETSLEGTFDPRTSIFASPLVFGSYAPMDQQTLLNDIQQNNVFSYDTSTVQPTNVDNQQATQFDVTVNANALKELNKKAAVMAGLDETEAAAAITAANFDNLSAAKVTITVIDGTQQIAKLVINTNGQTSTTVYSGFGTTTLDAEPTAEFQYSDFHQLLTGKAADGLATKADDIERQSDINSIAGFLETYYNSYKIYPQLSNMNNIAWVEANLKGLPDATMRDPKGTTNKFADTPTTNQYSYQVYHDSGLQACGGNDCGYFKVSATNSDGTVYSKESAAH